MSSASSSTSATCKLNAITDDRKLSFAGGVAILAEVFEQLGIESMRVADGAMREGLLYDLLGRYTDEDARERTVRSMQERYHVDLAQAERVEATAVDFLAQVEEAWPLDRSRDRAASCAGPRACTRSASTSRTAAITAMAPIYWRMRTWPGFRAKNRSCWPSWWAATGASRRSKRRTISRRPGTNARPR